MHISQQPETISRQARDHHNKGEAVHSPGKEERRAQGARQGPTATLPKRRSDLNVRMVDGETIVLDRSGGFVHQLNQTASYIWDCCDGTSTIAAMSTQLAEAFDVTLETAETDVVRVIDQLRQLNLLEVH
jgi:hypothetical protein